MAWRIEIGDKARQQLADVGPVASKRIIVFLRTRVASSDDPGWIGQPLKGSRLGGFWRYRVGDYRVVVSIEDQALRVLVVQIGHRSEVYR